MNKKELTTQADPADMFWKVKKCCYCCEQITLEEFQRKKYRLFKAILSSGMLVMAFHKKCWTKYSQDNKKALEQITNDPIYRWSRGEWITHE